MKKPMLYLCSMALTSILLISCADESITDTPPASTTVVATKTTLYFPTVTANPQGQGALAAPSIGATCDQLTITSVRILLSNLTLLRDETDTIGSGVLKEGPFVAYFLPGETITAAAVSVAPGIFDRVKFEVHKYNASFDSLIEDMSDFTTSERNTVIIEGTVYSNGVALPFVYKSRMTINVQDAWEAPLTITTDPSGYTVFIDFYPPSVFMTLDGQVLDPRDLQNAAEIDAAIKTAFISRTHLGA